MRWLWRFVLLVCEAKYESMRIRMATEQIIFKHPPVTEAQVAVLFLNNFEVADQRSRFHKVVADEYPFIIMPEQNKLQYDFGDYVLQKQDGTERIEVGMNYFRFTSVRYPGFTKFRELFLNSLNKFLDCYEIKSFFSLSMSYRNTLPLAPGSAYKDCFALNISLPDYPESELFAGQGILVFKKPEGFLTVQLEPKIESGEVQLYSMHLLFATNQEFTGQFDRSQVPLFADTTHDHLRRFFFGMLTQKYLEYLRTK